MQGVKPFAVEVAVVEEAVYKPVIRATGRMQLRDEFRLSFKQGGVIERVMVRDGDRVRRGEVLARLNPSEINAMKEQADLALEKAVRDFERAERLYSDNVATLEQYQNAATARDLAIRQKEIAGFNLKHSVIRAPADGLILKVISKEGEITGAGMPVVAFASAKSNWVIRAAVADREITGIRPGNIAFVVPDAFPDTIRARLIAVPAMADPYTGTFETEAELINAPSELISGMIGEISIFSDNEQPVLRIPFDALTNISGDRARVWIPVDNSYVKFAGVLILNVDKDYAMVLSEELVAGDRVITKGAHDLGSGSRIVIIK